MWAPTASPQPLALQAQALMPPSLGSLLLEQLGSPGTAASHCPGHSSAQPGRCRLAHSFDFGHCFPSAKKGLKQGKKEDLASAVAEKLWPGCPTAAQGQVCPVHSTEGQSYGICWQLSSSTSGWEKPQGGNWTR